MTAKLPGDIAALSFEDALAELEKIDPALAERYARWSLAQAGRPVPARDALGALALAFPMPEDMLVSMKRQIDLSFSGI